MYIIQELIDENTWFDKYKNNDYELICEFYHNYCDKYIGHKFRIIEVFFYV